MSQLYKKLSLITFNNTTNNIHVDDTAIEYVKNKLLHTHGLFNMSDYIPLLTCLLDSTSSQAQQENAWLALGYLYTIKPFSVNHIHS